MSEAQFDENGLKKTPLYDYYLDKGLKITDFGGWGLPIQFTKIQEEHDAVREKVGIFDTSHMGEIVVKSGKENAFDWFNTIITNDTRKIKEDGKAQYTAIIRDDGGMLDDMIYYRVNKDELVATPNGANTDKIYEWLVDHNKDGAVEVVNETFDWGLIPVQGPNAEELVSRLTDADLASIEYYSYSPDQTLAGVDNVQISRTGYTGESGFELYIPYDDVLTVWNKLLEEGQDLGVTECALGARDTLRLEAGLPLYGNDFDESVNPVAGGVAFAVPKKKEVDYVGRDAIVAYREGDQVKETSRGFTVDGTKIPRQGMDVKNKDGEKIGVVTSATKSPTFGNPIGFIRLDRSYKPGDTVIIDVRGKDVEATLNKKDWLDNK
ncbi:Aminomethyltransferase [Alloiococcus otitis]|uniref:Aminomethyltransferase n=1 Tax=Alloiococcus otitis ATCC 51267 TaxID=883081 RepID=K9ESE0_9LACT|nr:glycine cleavage system aminomethyltransferase GcvT [Alloiococcus otitis]EKU93852.1 glycine cleavage system T protein [Alloiococcus otitis ATCC 51267]SUU81849.1 Aminomethyltransferase [Alloiococcus otitis]